MNITVRINGVINNDLPELEFVAIALQLFGADKSLDEYIELYNTAPQAIEASIVVHKEVETVCD